MLTEEEITDLIKGIHERYGYDFSGYSRASLQRRVSRYIKNMRLESLEQLKNVVFHDKNQFESFLQELTVNVTEMFRDPEFFLYLRSSVFPILSTYPYIKIWIAGCSTGEELYSLAIMLHEEGLLHKSKLYATDLNQKVLKVAKEGIYPASTIAESTGAYYKSGGKNEFSDYYTSNYGAIKYNSSLIKNVVFYPHNLATDSSFNEFQLILCRNVLIYFNKELQDKVLRLFSNSLVDLGYLGLGKKETLYLTSVQKEFEVSDKENKVYRKIR